MKPNRILCRANIGVLVVALSAPLLHATGASTNAEPADGEVRAGHSGSGTQNAVEDSRLARLLKEASLSQGVGEVARMADLGTDTSVLTAYVENSDKPYQLRPEDIAHLRGHGVPDSVITAMIERGAQVRAETPPAPQPVQPVQTATPQPASTVVYVPSLRRSASPPASTLVVIGRSDLRRGLSYRNYYYSPWHYYSSRPYDTVYASFGNYGRYYHRPACFRPYRYRVYR